MSREEQIRRKLAEQKWVYAPQDPEALRELVSRIEERAKKERLITYSELVQGVEFQLGTVVSFPVK